MNVLFISITNVIGGAEIVAKSWIENTEHKLYIVTCQKEKNTNFYKDIKSDNIKKVYYVKKYCNSIGFKNKVKYLIDNFRVAINIDKIIKNNKIDIIYSNNTSDFFSTIFYKIFINKKIKLVNHIHDMLTPKSYQAKLLGYLSKFSDSIIVPSGALKIRLEEVGVNKSKIKIVYNSVDSCDAVEPVENIKFLSKDFYPILFVGTYSEVKNVYDFIKIIKGYKAINPKCIGIIAGRVEDEEYYSKIIKYINEEEINILTLRDLNRAQINYLYSISKLLILTSNSDTFPTVILESMHNKLLVYARDVDGVSEIIEEKKTGYIYNYEADVVDIIDKLDEISSKDNLKIIDNAYEKIITDFTTERKISAIDTLITSIKHQ